MWIHIKNEESVLPYRPRVWSKGPAADQFSHGFMNIILSLPFLPTPSPPCSPILLHLPTSPLGSPQPFIGKPQDSVLRDKRYQTKRETDRLNERQIERETDQETRRQTDREEDRYTERWTGRETCSKTSRQTERETSRETYRYTDSETDCSLLTAEWELSLVQSGSLPRSAVTTSSSQRSYPRSAFTNTSNQRSLRQAAAFCGGAGPNGSAGSMPSSAVMVTKEQLMLDLVQSEVG